MRAIDISRQARDFLEALPVKQGKQIASKLDALATNPLSVPSRLIRGGAGERRVKAGEFRIIYEIDEAKLTVWLIDRRNDDQIYRRLRRL